LKGNEFVAKEVDRTPDIKDHPKDAKPSPNSHYAASSNKAHDGEWIERTAALYETEAITCDVCGKIMPKRYWQLKLKKYCSPDCYEMYLNYWKPRYEG
jgi:hypothetical protein